MSEFIMCRLRENLEALKMKNTLEIYLERTVAENLNSVEVLVLEPIFSEEAKSKRRRAYEKQIQMYGFPIKNALDDFDFSFQPFIDKRQMDELATMCFLENGENMVRFWYARGKECHSATQYIAYYTVALSILSTIYRMNPENQFIPIRSC